MADYPISIVQSEYGRVTVNLDERTLVAHAHAETHIIFKLGANDAPFRVGNDRLEANDDHALVIRPWTVHARLAGGPSVLLVLWLKAAWLKDALGIAPDVICPEGLNPMVALDDTTLAAAQTLAKFVRESTFREPDEINRSVETVARTVMRDQLRLTGIEGPKATPPRLTDARIHRAIEFMNRQPTAELHVDIVAAHVGLSRSRFFEQFKLCLGVTPQQYIDWIRMRHATLALSTTGKTVATISDELGFASQSHFSRFFSEHLGLPPGEFRRRAVSMNEAITAG
jgi:AraC-like DNA-binding protein